MDTYPLFKSFEPSGLTNDGEQSDYLSNSVLGNLFGFPLDESVPSPPKEMGTADQVPSQNLLESLLGSSPVNRDDNLLEDPLPNSPQGFGNKSEAAGFRVTCGAFHPQWNGPSDIELTQQLDTAEHASGNLENMVDNRFDSNQQFFSASPFPQPRPPCTTAYIADPQDPLQRITTPNIVPPIWASDQMTQGEQNIACTASEENRGFFLHNGNTGNSEESCSGQNSSVPTNSLTNEELLKFKRLIPTAILSESHDLTLGDQLKDDSNRDEDSQPSENGSDMDTDEGQELFCPECNLKFGNKDSLRRHQKRAHRTSEKQIRCDNCNGKFANKVNLQRHIRNVHTGEQNFACDLCSATFSTSRSLCIHKGKEHSDVPPEQGGPRKWNVRSKQEVYTCRLCSYSSNQNYNVKRHFTTVHLKQGYLQCPHPGCDRICMSKANFNTHIFTCRKRSKK